MKKQLVIVLCVLFILLFSSCITTFNPEGELLTYEDDNVELNVAYNFGRNYIGIDLKNKTNDGIIFITDYASCNGEKLVFGETRVLDANKSQAVVPIAPNISLIENMYLTKENSLIRSGSNFTFGYKTMDGKEEMINMTYKNIALKEQKYSELLGSVSVTKQNWVPLFLIPPPSSRQETLKNMLLAEAKKQYGENVVIDDVKYEGDWNGLSLIFYFSMLGWVEDASAIANVYRP